MLAMVGGEDADELMEALLGEAGQPYPYTIALSCRSGYSRPIDAPLIADGTLAP